MPETSVIVSTTVTFIFFFMEALIHYNLGKTGQLSISRFPRRGELVRLIFTIAFFSFLSAVVIKAINTYM